MSHEVETMAYVREEPWHGLGTRIEGEPGVDEMTRKAGLDWRVDKAPMVTVPDKSGAVVEVPGHYALIRDTDDKCLGVCGEDFVVTQNSESMDFFRQFVDAGAATLETAGSLRGGKVIWALANLNHDLAVGKDDKLKSYVLLSNSHEPGRSLVVKATSVRVVCMNTLAMALSGRAEFRMRHVKKFDAMAQEKAVEALGIARGQLAEFARNAAALKSLAMDAERVQKWVLELVAPDVAGVDDNRVAKAIMEAYYMAPGAEPGNAWGALNAVTYYVDHMQPTRGTDFERRERRLERAWYGEGATLKQMALDSLLVAA